MLILFKRKHKVYSYLCNAKRDYMEILIILLLILLNGVFAMSEVALISARKSNLRIQAAHGSRTARRALELAEDPDKFLSTVQIGITLISILTGIFSGAAFADDLGRVFAAWGVPSANAIAQAVIVIVVTYFSIVFGELVPKRIGMNLAEGVAKVVAMPMYYLSKLMSPFVWLLSKSIELVTYLLCLKDADSKVTEAEIKSIIQEGAESGEVQEVEQRIMGRVFSLGDRTVDSIMTHRSDMIWLSVSMDADAVREKVSSDPHSVYPVIDDNPDRLLGVVYLKDLFSALDSESFNIRDIIHPAKYFHELNEVYNALEQLRVEHLRYGVVCDEFGVTQGIFTLQDILEALLGDMPAEREEPNIVERADGSLLVDGKCPFYDFLAYYAIDDVYDHSAYNTISGLILDIMGHIPTVGEKVSWNEFDFEVVDMDSVRIDKIMVRRKLAV